MNCKRIVTGDYKIAGLQDCKIAGLQDYKSAGLQGCKVTRLRARNLVILYSISG
jgi:hypothetical protein